MNDSKPDWMTPDLLIRAPLEAVAHRQRRLNFWCKLAACWGGAAFAGLFLLMLERQTGWGSSLLLPLVALGGIVAAVIVTLRHSRQQPNWRQLAQRIEALYPDLDSRLLTAVQQQGPAGADLNYLQQRLLQQTLLHSQNRDWSLIFPRSRLFSAQAAHWLAVVLLVTVLWGLRTTSGTALLARIPATGVSISPGDISLEKGSSLVVLARFGSSVPSAAELVLQSEDGASRRIPLVRNLADPVFGGMVPEVHSNLAYHVAFGARDSAKFKVKVFEYPRLERADVDLSFPEYTGQEPKRIQDTRRVSAVEGTSLDLTLQLNKPVLSARLVAKNGIGPPIPLVVVSNQPLATLSRFPLAASSTYELQLVDAEGRTNKVQTQFVFHVLKNGGPELKLALPRGDQRPSPLEEVAFQGTVWDEFGILSYGLGYTIDGQDTQFIELGSKVPAREKKSFDHVLHLEDLKVEPDQLIAWFVWAEDLGPDGKPRRTVGDLFFGEVRPFDEVFQEGEGGDGQSPPGAPSGSRADRMGELQKQIMNATWNLQREYSGGATRSQPSTNPASRPKTSPSSQKTQTPVRLNAARGLTAIPSMRFFGQRAAPSPETGRSRQPTPAVPKIDLSKTHTYKEDLGVLLDAQRQALEQAQASLSTQEDPRLTALLNTAIKAMENAVTRLSAASNSPALLEDALVAEQAAYSALLKLQQHNYQVSRNRQRNQSGAGGSREQQMQLQLEQMDLTRTEDRYETQRQAQPQQDAQRREDLQMMNRLQELARRQQDLNERLKELQTALQEAKTEEEREEIRRRLKRLQEEEQQMLADVDELRQRMERPENQSRMAEERRQLEQTREDVQRAAEAAAQGQPSQALASGTRAQRQLQDMRDRLRKENSSQFSEDLRQMRNDARELARQHQELLEKMNAENGNQKKSLSDTSDRQQQIDQLGRQRQRLTNVVEKATQISQDAEQSEPLLSRQLYETLRKFSQETSTGFKQTQEEMIDRGLMNPATYERLKQSPEQDGVKLLDLTAEMLRQEFLPQARQAGQRAQGGIEELKRGVERAADSVIGDDTEALKLAQQQLDKLMDQLQREMARAEVGSGTTNRAPTAGASNARQPGNRTNQLAAADGQPSNTGEGSSAAEDSTNRQPAQLANADRETREGQPGQPQSTDQGQTPGQNQSGTQPANQQQASPGRETASEPGQTTDNAQAQPNEGPSTQPGQPGQPGQNPGESNQQANQQANTRSGRSGANRNAGGGVGDLLGRDWDRLLQQRNGIETGPLIGEDFGPWSDQLRDVEELVDLPDLRSEVATARERARLLRQEYKREGKKPDWAVVRLQVIKPLVEVRDRISEELARRDSEKTLVPIDRDPVPSRYSELVRRYFEELGKER